MADATCSSCIVDAYVEINPDPGATPQHWYELPAVLSISKAAVRNEGTTKRHSNSNGVKVNVCSQNSKSFDYTITALHCDLDPIDCYLKDGHKYNFRILKRRGTTAPYFVSGAPAVTGGPATGTHAEEAVDAGVIHETFEGTYDAEGYTWDNDSEDGEERSLLFHATSTPVMNQVSCVVGTPKGDALIT